MRDDEACVDDITKLFLYLQSCSCPGIFFPEIFKMLRSSGAVDAGN